MRSVLIVCLLVLLLPTFALAQDTAPVIAVLPYLRNQDIYGLQPGETPVLLAKGDTPEGFLSPDGSKLAVLDFPAFVQSESQLEPGDYPDDLFVIDLASGDQISLLEHDPAITLYSTSGDRFYNSDFSGGVVTPVAWDDPNSIGGGRLFAFLAWSPESDRIAQVQTVVSDGQYPGIKRLVIYDMASGEMSVIDDLGASASGRAVFWFDEGIVLYTDPREGDDSITVYSPEGEVLYEWSLESRMLAHENPVRYEGRDYIAFQQWSLFDVATGEFTPVDGTIARVSTVDPANSLVIEACNDRDELRPAWDVYSAGGDKLTNLKHVSTPTLSPDGTQVIYTDYDADRAVTVFDGVEAHLFTEIPYPAETVLWGATIYTITPVGMNDCGRVARG